MNETWILVFNRSFTRLVIIELYCFSNILGKPGKRQVILRGRLSKITLLDALVPLKVEFWWLKQKINLRNWHYVSLFFAKSQVYLQF